MTVRHLVSARALTAALPNASDLADATTSVIDGVTFVVRAGYWFRIDNDGQLPPTGAIPGVSSPEQRATFTNALTCTFIRPDVVDTQQHRMQASWFNYDGPLTFDGFGSWIIGQGGFYAVNATVSEIDNVSTDVDFAIVLETMFSERFVLATYRPLAGGMRTEHALHGWPTGYGAQEVIYLHSGVEFTLNVVFYPRGTADITEVQVPSHLSVDFQLLPILLQGEAAEAGGAGLSLDFNQVATYFYTVGSTNMVHVGLLTAPDVTKSVRVRIARILRYTAHGDNETTADQWEAVPVAPGWFAAEQTNANEWVADLGIPAAAGTDAPALLVSVEAQAFAKDGRSGVAKRWNARGI